MAEVKKKAKESIGAGDEKKAELAGKLFKDLERDIVRGNILKTGVRIDGRDGKTVRQIVAEQRARDMAQRQGRLPGLDDQG